MKKENYLLELEKQECLRDRSVGEKGMLSRKSRIFSRKGKHGFVWVKLVFLKRRGRGRKMRRKCVSGKRREGRVGRKFL